MNDNNKTKQQLIKELEAMRQRVTGVEKSEAGCKQKVDVLQKSEEYFRAITQNSSDIIIVVDRKGTITYVNPSIERFLGYKPEELIGKSGFDFIMLADIPRAIYDFGRAIVTKDVIIQNAFRVRHKDGSEHILEGVGDNLLDNAAAAGFVMNVRDITARKRAEEELGKHREHLEELVEKRTTELKTTNEQLQRDITDRKRAEEALRDSEERYRFVVQNLKEVVFRTDEEGHWTLLNPAWAELTGFAVEESLGKVFLEYVYPDDRELNIKLFRPLIEKKKDYCRHEIRYINRDGGFRWIEVWARLTLDEKGSATGTAGTLTDITERKQADEKLRETTQRYHTILSQLYVGTLVVSEDNHIEYANRTFCDLFGFKDLPSELIGLTVEEMIKKMLPAYADPAKTLDRIREIVAQRQRVVGDEVLMSDGRILLVDFVPIMVDGKQSGRMWQHRDITKRRLTEDALRESEAKFRALADSLSSGMFLIQGTKYIYINPAFELITGYTMDDLADMNFWDIVHIDSQELVRERNFARRRGESMPSRYEIRIITKNNEERWVDLAATLIEFENKPTIMGSAFDITERKRAEDGLRKALLDLQELNFIVNKSPAIAFLWRAADNWPVEFVSENIAQFGYMPDDLTSGRIPYAFIVHPDDLKRIADEVTCHIQDGRTEFIQEYRIITKSGEVRWIDDRTWIRQQADGQITHHQGIVIDITERKSLEERLHRAEKMEALGTLAGGVAHDLNNVLGIVVGYSELLLEMIDESNTIRSYVKNLMQGGERAAAIVQDLLTLARRGVHTEKVINLNTTIDDYQKSPEFEKLCSFHPDVQINTNLEPGLLNISGSPVHLGKTFFNLASNAAEAMPNGGVLTITTSNQYLERPIQGYDDVREGDYVVLSVSDTGEGIATADLKRIFEPFYTKKVMGRSGTGLGLAVVWGTVKDHNGYINVQSKEGKGTTFTLYFPVMREEVTKDQASIPVSEYLGNGESILVVDDVEGQRQLASHMLRRLNYNAVTVSSGEEAIEYLKTNKADLIILDMIMNPGIDGLDTFRMILEINPKQKAIIVSGFSETVRVSQTQALGAGAYVKKPYVMERLGLAVRKELDKR